MNRPAAAASADPEHVALQRALAEPQAREGAGARPISRAHEDLRPVFDEPFRQGRAAHPGGDGTGLGLALVKRFAELHGGSVRVDSEPGRGSTFAFILPWHDSREAS